MEYAKILTKKLPLRCASVIEICAPNEILSRSSDVELCVARLLGLETGTEFVNCSFQSFEKMSSLLRGTASIVVIRMHKEYQKETAYSI